MSKRSEEAMGQRERGEKSFIDNLLQRAKCFVDQNQHLLHNNYQDSRGNYVLKYYFATDTPCEKHWEENR